MGWQELSDKEELMKEILAKTEEETARDEAATCLKFFQKSQTALVLLGFCI